MADKDTIIVVGVTRMDTYGNLFVTPTGGGDEVKIGEKRTQLHDLFQQGKAVMLHWETYKNRAYVADAKLVEGELPEQQSSQKLLPKDQKIIDEEVKVRPTPQDSRSKEIEFNMWWKIASEMVGNNALMEYIEANFKSGKAYRKAMTMAVITQSLAILPIKVEDK